MFEPISRRRNYFVGVDGEGIGNDYVLLDSSLSDYPRLCTGDRLTTLECLDWLYGLAQHAGYCIFVLYGAGYDYNNWLRDLPFEDVKRLAASQPVRVGDYLVLWQQGFKFELRRIADENTSAPEYSADRYRYSRIRTRLGSSRQDYKGVVFWDVLPFWQCSFEKALDMTLGAETLERALIAQGKAKRGAFDWEDFLSVDSFGSLYNKAEVLNLAHMMVRLDDCFDDVGITPLHWNGPGSAAKALLRAHEPHLHAGRRIASRARSISSRVQEYMFPGADDERKMTQRALSAYAGGLNRQLKIGYHGGKAWQYDLISAYPSAMLSLPCLSHGEWKRTRKFDPHSFGVWKVRYKASKLLPLYPLFWRTPDGSIEYPAQFDERWVHTSELRAALAVDAAGVRILDGWQWEHSMCDNPTPFWWVRDVFAQRAMYKAAGDSGKSLALKLPLNSLYGSIAQARGGTIGRPPWSQQLLWAGAITAYTRARLYLAHRLAPTETVHLATDGLISLCELPSLRVGDGLGEWEASELTDLTCVQYGVYHSREKHRERGFRLSDDEAPEFIKRVHAMWETGTWQSMSVQQKLFVTAGLVAMSEARYEEWCHWKDITKEIELDQSSIFKMGHVQAMPGMWAVHDASYNLQRLGASKPYEPKWGKGEDFPMEWKKADAYEAAVAIER